MKQAEFTYNQIKKEYENYLTYRDKFIKWGLVALCTLPFLFMFLMFFLNNKVLFLGLWVISFILIAFFLTFIDYKGYYYKKLLNIRNEEDKKYTLNSKKYQHALVLANSYKPASIINNNSSKNTISKSEKKEEKKVEKHS